MRNAFLSTEKHQQAFADDEQKTYLALKRKENQQKKMHSSQIDLFAIE